MLRSGSPKALQAYTLNHLPTRLAQEAVQCPDYLIRRRYLLWEAARQFCPVACRAYAKLWRESNEQYAAEIAMYWTELCEDWLPVDPPSESPAALFYAAQHKEWEEKDVQAAMVLYGRAAPTHALAASSVFRLSVRD